MPVPKKQLDPEFSPRWYSSHHGIINPKKPDKGRVVIDCAAKFDSVSLNDRLFQRPDTTANLVGMLLHFRTGAVAVAADIEEMFMQVRVPIYDRGALRFQWWKGNNLHTEPKEYQMIAHPFGATSSPFCANYTVRQTLQDWMGMGMENRRTLVKLECLNPILLDGILRVGGRLQYAEYLLSHIHSIILPKMFHLTELIIRHYHLIKGHSVCALVLAAN